MTQGKRTKPEGVAAAKKNTHARFATAVAIPDRFLICPGSGMLHPQAFLPVMQGKACKFIRCPFHNCAINCFLNGAGWDRSDFDFGVTKAQIAKMNPGALIL